jgi:hypothetical protein
MANTEEQVEGLRKHINEIFGILREDIVPRLTRLEERSDNRDSAVDDLKKAIQELKGDIKDLSRAVSDLVARPGRLAAERWKGIVDKILFVVVGAFVAYVLSKTGIFL